MMIGLIEKVTLIVHSVGHIEKSSAKKQKIVLEGSATTTG